MALLVVGLVLFLGVHSLRIFIPDIREQVIARGGGVGAWMWPYTGIALTGFVLLVVGYALARQEAVLLYQPPAGLRPLAFAAMLPVFPLLIATYLKGRIGQAVGHPMLIATGLWASAHLLTNGSLPATLLFGGFLAWSLLAWRSAARREAPRQPAPAAHRGRNDILAIVGGLALYAALVGGLHGILFGAPLT